MNQEKGIFAQIFWGSIMISYVFLVNVFGYSFYSESYRYVEPMTEYTVNDGWDNLTKVMYATVTYISLIGWISAARGIYAWIEGPKFNQPGYVRKGVILLVVAVICTNFYLFIDMLADTVGARRVGTEYFKFNRI